MLHKNTVKAIQKRLDQIGRECLGGCFYVGDYRYELHCNNHDLKPYILRYSNDGMIYAQNVGIINDDWQFIPDVYPERRPHA